MKNTLAVHEPVNEMAALADVARRGAIHPVKPEEGCQAGIELRTPPVELGVLTHEALKGAAYNRSKFLGLLITQENHLLAVWSAGHPAEDALHPNDVVVEERPPNGPENSGLHLQSATQ